MTDLLDRPFVDFFVVLRGSLQYKTEFHPKNLIRFAYIFPLHTLLI